MAELYDRARAGYAAGVVDDVMDYAGHAGPGMRILEIGAGTGKATVAFAARGVGIVALEPSGAMAAVARRHCQRFPNVRIELSTFEAWPVERGVFDLVFSAQAWHWVRPEVRARKTADALVPGGALALFWHRTDWQGEDLRAELDDLYRRMAPDLHAQAPGFPGVTRSPAREDHAAEIAASGFFEDVTVRFHPWASTFTADTFVDLLLTQSDHRLLPDGQRAELLDAVRALVARHGDSVQVPSTTLLILARAR